MAELSSRPDPAELYRLLVEELSDYAIFVTDQNGFITTWP
jgi:hypothetical protein